MNSRHQTLRSARDAQTVGWIGLTSPENGWRWPECRSHAGVLERQSQRLYEGWRSFVHGPVRRLRKHKANREARLYCKGLRFQAVEAVPPL